MDPASYRRLNIQDWTSVTDVDGKVKIQDFDGNTIVTEVYPGAADLIVQLVAALREAHPGLLAQIELQPVGDGK